MSKMSRNLVLGLTVPVSAPFALLVKDVFAKIMPLLPFNSV